MKAMIAVLAMGFVISNVSFAEEAKPAAGMNHQEMAGKMAGKMDMGQMHSMMGECMKNHKDGKMCGNQTMEQCQKSMDHKDCEKMMKDETAKKTK